MIENEAKRCVGPLSNARTGEVLLSAPWKISIFSELSSSPPVSFIYKYIFKYMEAAVYIRFNLFFYRWPDGATRYRLLFKITADYFFVSDVNLLPPNVQTSHTRTNTRYQLKFSVGTEGCFLFALAPRVEKKSAN